MSVVTATLLAACGSKTGAPAEDETDTGAMDTGTTDTGTGEDDTARDSVGDSESDSLSDSESMGDTESDSGAVVGVCGASDAQADKDACAALCEANDNGSDCNSETLPEHWIEDVWHYCRWYAAVEVSFDSGGACVFGETRNVCGYALEGDWCGANSLWCEGEAYDGMFGPGAAYYVDEGKIFLIRHEYCVPTYAGRFTVCRWRQVVLGEFEQYAGVPECACACEM